MRDTENWDVITSVWGHQIVGNNANTCLYLDPATYDLWWTTPSFWAVNVKHRSHKMDARQQCEQGLRQEASLVFQNWTNQIWDLVKSAVVRTFYWIKSPWTDKLSEIQRYIPQLLRQCQFNGWSCWGNNLLDNWCWGETWLLMWFLVCYQLIMVSGALPSKYYYCSAIVSNCQLLS